MLRFTQSQDGKLRANVVYKVRLGLDAIAKACFHMQEDGVSLSRKSIEKSLRKYHIVETCGMWDEVDEQAQQKAFNAAIKHFPELKEPSPPRT